jgi:UDP-N-acetylmuramate dehydrogenase
LIIQNNISLRPYNTFGIDVKAERFVSVNTVEELRSLLKKEPDIFLLGGGSNILLTRDIQKLVIHLNFKGIDSYPVNEDETLVRVQAGENWHEFVLWCLDNDLGGVENLSLIPGNVGASPIQNIGAYGVEIKDVFEELTALNIKTGALQTFDLAGCGFGYRNSVFKNALKGQFIIVSVTFRLSRRNHTLNTAYGPVASYLEGIENPGIRDVSNAVIQIRRSKLPDPAELGNSGSFFKNPVVPNTTFDEIRSSYPDMPYYPAGADYTKVPAGWLIEQCGFKGKRYGDAGVHKYQALVLVNHGEATGQQILDLSERIRIEVNKTFGIRLESEVNIIS